MKFQAEFQELLAPRISWRAQDGRLPHLRADRSALMRPGRDSSHTAAAERSLLTKTPAKVVSPTQQFMPLYPRMEFWRGAVSRSLQAPICGLENASAPISTYASDYRTSVLNQTSD